MLSLSAAPDVGVAKVRMLGADLVHPDQHPDPIGVNGIGVDVYRLRGRGAFVDDPDVDGRPRMLISRHLALLCLDAVNPVVGWLGSSLPLAQSENAFHRVE